MTCCHGKESSAHQKSKPSTLCALTGTHEQLCIRPHHQPGDKAHVALPSTWRTAPALLSHQPEPASKGNWKLAS